MRENTMKHYFPFFVQLPNESFARLEQLVMDILADVQYVRLIVAKRPEAYVVHEVRSILAEKKRWGLDCNGSDKHSCIGCTHYVDERCEDVKK